MADYATPDHGTQEPRLEGWKEIAAHLQRDVRTAKRWENKEGLPVRRHSHGTRSSVYAFRSELDAWRSSRQPAAEPKPPRPLWHRPLPSFATGMVMLMALISVGDTTPEILRAQAQGVSNGTSTRLVWSGPTALMAISPDGSFATFSAGDNLTLQDLRSGTSRELTHATDGSYAERSVISPAGTEVAYTWQDGSGPAGFQVRIVATDGKTAPRIVYRNPNRRQYVDVRSWMPDGQSLLIAQGLGDATWQLALLDIQSGTLRQLKSFQWGGVSASLSPDGRFVAYDVAASDGAARDIFILAVDGSQETPLVQHAANDFSPVWTPDGSRILFVSDRTAQPSLWSIAVRDGKPAGEAELVKNGISGVIGMTEDAALYYTVFRNSRRDVYRAALGADGKASGSPEAVSNQYVNSNWGAELSPDGKSLAFYSSRPSQTLVIRDLESGRERSFPIDMGQIRDMFYQGPHWFPDGRSVLVLIQQADRPTVVLYRMNTETGNAEEVGATSGTRALTPDGKFVLCIQNGATRILRYDLDTRQGTVVREAPRGAVFTDVAISPDGRELAYNLQMRKGDEGTYLFTMPIQGGEPIQVFRDSLLLNGLAYNALKWTQDQRYLLFVKDADDSPRKAIWRVPVRGGEAEPVGVDMERQIKAPQIDPERGLFFSGIGDGLELWALENFLPAASAGR